MEKSRALSVLVIEDNQMFRNLAMQVLTGCQKYGAVTAKEGVAQFKTYRPDITFLDINLPDGNGFDVLLSIKKIDPKAFVIMLTQSRVVADVEKANSYGAAGYIVKPFSPAKIKQCMEIYKEYKKKTKDIPPEEFIRPIQQHQENKTEKIEKPVSENRPLICKVLFVDDYFANQVHAKKHFKKLGCDIDTAGDANQALELIQNNNYHIIFMDGKMPEKDGYEVTKEIRKGAWKLNKETPIIALAENLQETESQNWLRAGMNSFIIKPIKFSQLLDITRKYVEDHDDAVQE